MAGYANDFSKSNNALVAEYDGLLVASKMAKYATGRWARLRGITAVDIEDVLTPFSWHHTSKMYNRVNYFDPDDLREPGVRGRLYKLALARRELHGRTPVTLADCTVEWIEWSGTRRRPTATEMREEVCEVTFKPGYIMVDVVFQSGKTMRKNIGTRGFEIITSSGDRIRCNPTDGMRL